MGKLEISKDGIEVLEAIFDRQEQDFKMHRNWEHGWLKAEVKRATDILSLVERASLTLEPLKSVGISLNSLEFVLGEIYDKGLDILKNVEMKLDNHEKVFKKHLEDV